MKRLKVSFILGIYNAERTLNACLESIFMQDYPRLKYEVIIVDGGSTDRTLRIVKDFMKKYPNIKLFHNQKKLSEGRGMSKDIGVNKSKGEIVIFLDHDNIILHKDWLKNILYPFNDSEIMVSQSQLEFKDTDSNFIKYINALGVEDPFAAPVSLLSQIIFHPERFKIIDGKYYLYKVNEKNLLFGGANGCAFRKKVFSKINGYTRGVDVFASMAEYEMLVAVPIYSRIHHETSNDMLTFLKKKGVYFFRFINAEYKEKKFRWIPKDFRGKIKFALAIFYNLTLLGPSILALRQIIKTKRFFWIIHPFFLFFITLEYGLITLFRFRNFIKISDN